MNSNLKLVPLKYPNNKYLSNNIEKYYDYESNKISSLIIEESGFNTNKNILKILKEDIDLILIRFDINKNSKNNKNFLSNNNIKIPKYPILIKNYNTYYLILTPILMQQINGVNNNSNGIEVQFNEFLYRIKIILGGLIVNKELPNIKDIKIIDGYNSIYYNKNNILSNYFVNNVNKDYTKFIENNYHGWLSDETKYNLEFIIKKYKPKYFLELGAWYGNSTYYIKNLEPNIHLYTVDKFQNILTSKYESKSFEPLDKFYFKYLRYETFCKNLSKYSKNLFTIQFNIDNILELLQNYKKLQFDVIFIDAIKNKNKLINFINKAFINYPNTIIIGDDYVIDSVKEAVKILSKKYYFKINKSSYICSKKEIKNYDIVEKKLEKIYLKKDLIEKLSKNYDKKIIKKINTKNQYLILNKMIKNNEFKNFLQMFKDNKYNYDLNKPILEITNHNTLYNNICKKVKENNNDAIYLFNILKKIQKPKLVNNNLNLNYKDFLKYDIEKLTF